MRSANFVTRTRVVADERDPGRFHATVTEDWNAPFFPHGGLLVSMLARAMRERVADGQELRSITAVFAGRVAPGPATIDTAVLREGRSLTQATGTLRADGESAGVTATAVFGVARRGFTFTDARMPDVPPPERCRSFRDTPDDAEGIIPSPLWDRIEARAAAGHAPGEVYRPTTSEQAYWYRFDEPPTDGDGRMDPLSLIVLCDTMIGSVAERMGPGLPVWLAPSADLTVHLLAGTHAEWLLARTKAVRANDGYVSLDLHLWDPAEENLVAYATQVAFLTFPRGAPPEDLTPAD